METVYHKLFSAYFYKLSKVVYENSLYLIQKQFNCAIKITYTEELIMIKLYDISCKSGCLSKQDIFGKCFSCLCFSLSIRVSETDTNFATLFCNCNHRNILFTFSPSLPFIGGLFSLFCE